MQNNILYYVYPSGQSNKVFLVSNPNIELEASGSNSGYNHANKNHLYYLRLRNSSFASLALHALLISLLSIYAPAKQQNSAEEVVHGIKITGPHQLLGDSEHSSDQHGEVSSSSEQSSGKYEGSSHQNQNGGRSKSNGGISDSNDYGNQKRSLTGRLVDKISGLFGGQGNSFASPLDNYSAKFWPEVEEVKIFGQSINVKKIMENRYNLFPFATTSLSFPSGHELEARLNSDSLFLNPQLDFQKSGKPPLRLEDSGLQQIVDRMFSRTERYDKFMQVAGYFDKYDPNEGRLPDLLRENIRQNMLQPFGISLGLAREVELWGMLQVSAETKKFLDYSLSYINRNPSTRTSTEFLFFVDELAAGNLNALAELFDEKKNFTWTKIDNSKAYDGLMSIRGHYIKLLGERGLNTLKDFRSEYERKRMQILNAVIKTSPDNYRVNDAHFLIGKIFWDREEYDKALESWRRIKPSKSDMYHESYSGITDLLKRQATPSKEEITGLLLQEMGKDTMFMWERLRHFGYFPWEF